MKLILRYKIIIFLLLANLLVLLGNAQVKPDFIFDKASGCSPLTVSFTNTTSGASSNANYNWNFGSYRLVGVLLN